MAIGLQQNSGTCVDSANVLVFSSISDLLCTSVPVEDTNNLPSIADSLLITLFFINDDEQGGG